MILQTARVELGKVLTGQPDLWAVVRQGLKLI